MSTHAREAFSSVVLQRIYSEFLEMPGLRLTCQQAQRLWGLDAATCVAAVELLVERKFLHRTARGMYARLTEGPTERLLPHPIALAADASRRRIRRAV